MAVASIITYQAPQSNGRTWVMRVKSRGQNQVHYRSHSIEGFKIS